MPPYAALGAGASAERHIFRASDERPEPRRTPAPQKSLLLQAVLEGFLGLVHAAFRASFATLALLLAGYLVFGSLLRRPFDLLAYAGHVGHPSLRRACLFASLPLGVSTQPSTGGGGRSPGARKPRPESPGP